MSYLTAKHNIGDLNNVLQTYRQLSKKTDDEILQKVSGELAFNLKTEFRKIVVSANELRAELMARLQRGQFIKIRGYVREQVIAKRSAKIAKSAAKGQTSTFKLNLEQEVVRREIAVRMSGRGVMSVSSRYPKLPEQEEMAISRAGLPLSTLKINSDPGSKNAVLNWSGISTTGKTVAEGFSDWKPAGAVQRAIQKTHDNMMVYVLSKQLGMAQSTVRSMIKNEAEQAAKAAGTLESAAEFIAKI